MAEVYTLDEGQKHSLSVGNQEPFRNVTPASTPRPKPAGVSTTSAGILLQRPYPALLEPRLTIPARVETGRPCLQRNGCEDRLGFHHDLRLCRGAQ